MSEIDRIRRFLGAVRRRLLLRATLLTVGVGGGVMLLALTILAAIAAALGPAAFWPVVTASVMAVLALAAAGYGVWRPARGLRNDHVAARAIARLHPPVSSDLVSAVELEGHLSGRGQDAGAGTLVSPSLVRAFQGDVASAVDPLDPRTLVTMRPALLAVGALAGVALLTAGAVRQWPALAQGMRTLVRKPTLFEGAAVSDLPLVGDVRISYRYPAYTGLPARVVEGSTGDIVAVKGTEVKIETRPLRSARKALLLLGEDGARGQLDARLEGGQLSAELKVMESGSYRFWLSPLLGRPVRELRSHRVQAEPDTPPRVEIFGPADRLELPGPRPIEIGYTADDDYGLGNVELVYRVGNQPEQRQLLRDARGAKNAQGRTIWDPSQSGTGIGLGTGERIAYRIEAKDRDDVSGHKAGSSRTLYLVIQNPRASMEERLDRQREVLEKLSDALAERLERSPAGRDAAAAVADVPAARLAALQMMHDTEESHLALLGRLLDDDRRESNLSKALRSALGGMADRLGRLLREEAALLIATRGKPLAAGSLVRLEAAAEKQIAELEKDVLLLDDLIGRQRLEDLANLGKELTDAHQRLQDLLSRYKATKDEALRRQLEREARELRARLADLAQKIASLKARNDVPEEWRNMPEMSELAEKAKKFDELLEQGDDNALSKALAELGDNLQSLRQMLDQNAEGFGSERFPQENRVVAELMKKISDLEGDERTLQKETQGLAEKQEAEVERRLKGQLEDFLKSENEKVERLAQKLAGIPTGDPESALAEEVDRARDSAKQLKRLLAERDLAEAKGEAERAESSLDRATDHAEENESRPGKGEPSRGKRTDKKNSSRGDPEQVGQSLGEARTLAQEIADDLEKLLPRPNESLSPEEREQARGQAERQGSIGNRTDETAGEAARRLGKLPGLEKAEAELKSAAARMRQAAEMLKKSETKQAAGAQRDAADRLAKLRDSMQERSMGTGKQQRDPVRIPGADESSAPRAWRQELMDAMKEKAPERYRDEVRRYYEELVR